VQQDFRQAQVESLQGIRYQTSPPLMGGDKGEGEQTFYHPHFTLLNKDAEEFVTYLFYEYLFSLRQLPLPYLTGQASPIKGEALYADPAASCRELSN